MKSSDFPSASILPGNVHGAAAGTGRAPVATMTLDDPRASKVLAGCACAFGVFDGFHQGHRYIVGEAMRAAEANNAPSAIITFEIDPDELFRAVTQKKLMSNEQRIQTLCATGADAVVVLPFTRDFAALAPGEFLDKVFAAGAPTAIHVGSDFRFGCKASGTVETMRAWGSEHGMDVHAFELLSQGGAPITSTRIRSLLASCNIKSANELLGARHAITCPVESGRGEGESMGFKTANLSVPEAYRVLGDGVYAAYALIGDLCCKAAVSWGLPPTFKDVARHNCEAHILDFDGNLYGQELRLEFVEHLRPMRTFSTIEELVAAVQADIAWVRTHL